MKEFSKQASYPVAVRSEWDVVDSSKLQDYLGCPRYYLYRHVLGLDKDTPNLDLVFGSAWHAALEYLLQHDYSLDSVREAYETRFLPLYREAYTEEDDGLNSPKNAQRAEEALVEYSGRYCDDLKKYEVVCTEAIGEVPVSNDFSITYRMDAILRDFETGAIFPLEHKTSKNLNQLWLTQWDLSIQIGTYDHAMLMNVGVDNVSSVVINGAFFKKVKDDSKVEKHQFERLHCVRNNGVRLVWLNTVLDLLDKISRDYEKLSESKESDSVLRCFPLNPKNCTSYARKCLFHDFCKCFPNPLQKMPTLLSEFVVRFWNPKNE